MMFQFEHCPTFCLLQLGSKAFFSVSYSSLSKQLVASSADRHIRLYDMRSAGF